MAIETTENNLTKLTTENNTEIFTQSQEEIQQASNDFNADLAFLEKNLTAEKSPAEVILNCGMKPPHKPTSYRFQEKLIY